MKIRYKFLFIILALLAAISFDQMFWQKPGGLNFFLFVCLARLGGLVPIWLEKITSPWQSYLLLIPILFFGSATFWRSEPFTTTSNVLITLGSMALFVITLLNGAWMRYRLRDHFISLFKLILNCFAGGILFFIKIKQSDEEDQSSETNTEETAIETAQSKKPEEAQQKPPSKMRKLKKALPFLRGILLALPIIAVLAGLLAAADPIFSDRLVGLFTWFNIDDLDEYLFRAFYILVISFLLLSAYFYGLVESQKFMIEEGKEEKSLFKPFLGAIEANIVLISVNTLFLFFVIIQFTYLFGGRSNISVEGYTFSEYARRGFFELLAVAILSLLLFYSLSAVTKRNTKSKRWIFSILGVVLLLELGVILASAYTRMNLYEIAYGYTRLRTVTHMFMIWIGVLLLATVILEISQKLKRFALILIFFAMGYGLTLNFLNVDRFIVEQNISRSINTPNAEEVVKLDTGYLYSLSYDSIPPLVAFFTAPETPEGIKNEIGGVLACRLADIDLEANEPLTSYHYARSKAVQLLSEQMMHLSDYPISSDEYGYITYVEVNGVVKECRGNSSVR